MGETTYKVIKRTEYENRGDAPVYIDTSEVMLDESGGAVMKLKLYNNCGKTVRSAYFNAGCFDSSLNLCIQLKNVPYVNVNAKAAGVFGDTQLVEVPGETRSVFVEVAKILFEDGSSWVNPNQSLAENIVSEDQLGEEWKRLRLTKEIKDKNAARSGFKKKMSENKKLAVIFAAVAATALIAAGGAAVSKHFSERQLDYKTAMNYYINRDYAAAAPALAGLDENYFFFGNDKTDVRYSAAIAYMNTGDYLSAAKYFSSCGDYKNSVTNLRNILNSSERLIAAGYNHSAAAKKDGTVIAEGDNSYGQCGVSDWSRVIGVAAGGNHTVGMTYDGMLYACGDNEYGQCDVSGWTDIVAVATGEKHTAAIKANGRVIARGNNEYGQCDVQEWSDIVQIAAAGNHTIGLRRDGTVLAAGWDQYGQCDVEGETGVLYIATGSKNTVLVKNDGSVKVLGDDSFSQKKAEGEKNIIAAAVGTDYIILLSADGKAQSFGSNGSNQGSVGLWSDILAVTCGNNHTLGLSSGGKIYAVGDGGDNKLKITTAENIGPENIPVVE